jgi:membrane associated rhomboid family serine protease
MVNLMTAILVRIGIKRSFTFSTMDHVIMEDQDDAPEPANEESSTPTNKSWRNEAMLPCRPRLIMVAAALATGWLTMTNAPTWHRRLWATTTPSWASSHLAWLWHHPATLTLILLNLAVAYAYHYAGIAPAAVGLLVNRMLPPSASETSRTSPLNALVAVDDDEDLEQQSRASAVVSPHCCEIWRVFSGGLAHFQPWHLGLNMWSLFQLGSAFEGNLQDSVTFLLLNISFLLLVGVTWLVLHRTGQRLTRLLASSNGNSPLISWLLRATATPDAPTIGYSGVLFAWSTILACRLIRPGQDWLGPLSNVMIPLVVTSMVMPNVSFSGHLAGVLVGILFHFQCLPISYIQPACLIPWGYLVYLIGIRRLSWRPSEDIDASAEALPWFRRILVLYLVAAALSFGCFGFLSPQSWSFVVAALYWQAAGASSSSRAVAWMRGHVVSLVLIGATDVIALLTDGISTKSPWLALVHLVRVGVCFIGLREGHFLLNGRVEQPDEESFDIFRYTMQIPILEPLGKCRGRPGSPAATASSSAATLFPGTGRTLGSSTRAADVEASRSRDRAS